MSRSRSRSLPRERSTRRRRSPSRSRSRSYDRRLSRRSRSRNPVERHTRNRSPSIASSLSGNEESRHKRHRKHSKEKKRHKKHKHKKDKEKEGEGGDEATAASEQVLVNNEEGVKEQLTNAAPVNAKSFFEQLQKQEAAKDPVGTNHARGLPAPVSATAISTSDKWECSKAGCGHLNSKHAPACNKCGAMKRMTEWR